MPNIGVQELLLILLIVVLLFGAKKIPELAAGLGKGVKEFKKAQREAEKEIAQPPSADSSGDKDKKPD